MLKFDIDANVRKIHGKGAARTLRRDGQTPAVLYGTGAEAVSLELNTRAFTKTLHAISRRNAVITLEIADGKKKKTTQHVMIKELQVDPVKDTPLHADFISIDVDTPMTLGVELHFNGNSKGVELGGVMNIAMRKVDLKGLAMDIPDFIAMDISDLDIGDSLDCKSLTIPENVEILDDPDRTCVAIVEASRVVEEVVEGEEGEEGAEGAEGAEAAAEGGGDQAADSAGESSE